MTTSIIDISAQRLPTLLFRLLLAVTLLLPALYTVASAEHAVVNEHEINFDTGSRKKVGAAMVKSVSRFFHDAEVAIETENIDALMALYSNAYHNGDRNKASVVPIWKRIFKQFDNIYSKHNMRFITGSEGSNTAIIRCSGILMGTPKGKDKAVSIALDYWINNDHILVKEKGGWRLIGTAGKEQQRFGFDKPLHPLF